REPFNTPWIICPIGASCQRFCLQPQLDEGLKNMKAIRITKTRLPFLAFGLALLAAATSLAQNESPPSKTVLFQNVRIFDGKNDHLSPPSNVLVRGNKIEKISTDPIPADRRTDTVLINGNGRTLMPGLIDAHWHAMMAAT